MPLRGRGYQMRVSEMPLRGRGQGVEEIRLSLQLSQEK